MINTISNQLFSGSLEVFDVGFASNKKVSKMND